jgi:asparagine synthase (glutamine-hydrolysing)
MRNQQVILAIDGEIYNSGEILPGGGDLDAILHLYRRHGFEAMLSALNGDFSLAIYDQAQETLFLARDRFGVKPLYYTLHPGYFLFASQIKSIMAVPGAEYSLSREYIGRYAGTHYRYIDNGLSDSPFAEIHQLPGSCYLSVTGSGVSVRQWWRLEEKAPLVSSFAELAGQYRDLLIDAVQIRMNRTKNPVFTLSGGMDSSSVLSSSVHLSGKKQPAISSVYEDKTYDESDEIQTILEPMVSGWHPVRIEFSDLFSLVEQIIRIHDEPIPTLTWLSHYILTREASVLGFDSLFGGLGGDELNAGEYEYFLYFFADLVVQGNPRLDTEVSEWIRYHDHPVFRKSLEIMHQQLATLVDLQKPGRIIPDRNRIERYKKAIRRDFFDVGAFNPVLDHPFSSYLKNRCFQDLMRETIPCCLRAEERNCTAFGLKHLLPFLDHRLAELLFQVSELYKYNNGVTKYLLREAMTGIVPEETRTRVKKTGWNAPGHQWFTGGNAQKLREIIQSENFHASMIYHREELLRILDEHEAIVSSGIQKENHMMFLWQLINTEIWLRNLPK